MNQEDDDVSVAQELGLLRERVSENLREGGEFWALIVHARARIAKAKNEGDEVAAARAAAEYGAVVKRWRRFLILELTQIGLDLDGVGREFVRRWQKATFGQAVASSALAQYAKPQRSGGGRAENVPPSASLESSLRRFYEANKEKVKGCVRRE